MGNGMTPYAFVLCRCFDCAVARRTRIVHPNFPFQYDFFVVAPDPPGIDNYFTIGSFFHAVQRAVVTRKRAAANAWRDDPHSAQRISGFAESRGLHTCGGPPAAATTQR